METITTNKHFIKASIALVLLLSLFVLALLVNEVRMSRYIGRGNTPLPTISVNGKGEVTSVPDIATLSVNLSKEASTSKEAQKLLNNSLSKTLDYLKTKNIADKDIKSEYGGVSPKYDYTVVNCFVYPCPQPNQKVSGYIATQSINIKVRAVDDANDIRTGLASLGITDISGPTFSVDNEDGLKDQARALAIKDARARAKVLARDLGVELGEVTSFSDNSYYPTYALDATYKSTSALELPKGENKIISNVMISYELR